MGMRRKKNFRFWIIMIFFLIISLTVYVYYSIPETPELEMRLAYESLSKAKKAQADIYARELYNEAKEKYDSAMFQWTDANADFYFFRDYSKVKLLARQSMQLSTEATASGYHSLKKSSVDIRNTIEMIDKESSSFEKSILKLPIPSKLVKDFSRGKIVLEESKIAWRNGQFDLAEKRLENAKRLILNTINVAEEDIQAYFRNFSAWENQAEQSIKNSKSTNIAVVIIDKFAQECKVYVGGNLRKTFSIELGSNWLGHKQFQGDNTTPEGTYKIIEKKEKRKTIYHKALLLNYPNEGDKAKFNELKSKGAIPGNSAIGGNIEIHGEGGKGFHWTNGCIALENKDMDVLYRLVSVNTPVTIVGSLIPFNEWKAKMLEN